MSERRLAAALGVVALRSGPMSGGSLPPRRGPVVVAILAVWTLGVWASRVYLIVARNGGDGVDLARAIAFVAVGLAVAAVAVGLVVGPRATTVVTVACWASILLWATRIVTIPMGDHPAGFVVVHLVLAAISIALAVAAMSAMRRRAAVDELEPAGRVRPATPAGQPARPGGTHGMG